MDIRQAIALLDASRTDGELPEEVFFFISRHAPLVCVDLLIQNSSQETLLTWRDDRFFGRGWHLPGGVIRFGELRDERIAKVARAELGCRVTVEPDPLAMMEYRHRQPRERSHQYAYLMRCAVSSPPDESRRWHPPAQPRTGDWHWHRQAPEQLLEVHKVYAALIDQPEAADSYRGRHVGVDLD
jgi:ADP-ribose pyrophosphatase YjhB (NUDIX family)